MNRFPGPYRLLRHLTKSIWQITLLALMTGGFIYIFLRPVPPLFFGLLELSGLSGLLDAVRLTTLTITPMVPDWVVYSLPQGLWAFAYAVIIMGIWKNRHAWISYLWLSTIPLLVFGFEGLQYTGVVRGTYCLLDMLFGMGGIVLGVILLYDKQWSLLVKKNCA